MKNKTKKEIMEYLYDLKEYYWELVNMNFDYCMDKGININDDKHYNEVLTSYRVVCNIIDDLF